MEESRNQFEYEAGQVLNLPTSIIELARKGDGYDHAFDSMNIMQPLSGWWLWWKKSRAAMEPVCWRTYYPDTDENSRCAHSESGAESCAKRIASEIGGYVVPVYYGEPQQCAAGLKIKGE